MRAMMISVIRTSCLRDARRTICSFRRQRVKLSRMFERLASAGTASKALQSFVSIKCIVGYQNWNRILCNIGLQSNWFHLFVRCFSPRPQLICRDRSPFTLIVTRITTATALKMDSGWLIKSVKMDIDTFNRQSTSSFSTSCGERRGIRRTLRIDKMDGRRRNVVNVYFIHWTHLFNHFIIYPILVFLLSFISTIINKAIWKCNSNSSVFWKFYQAPAPCCEETGSGLFWGVIGVV